MKTQQYFTRLNKRLTDNLIPDKSLPIYCNSVMDYDSEIFEQPLKNHGL